MISNIDAILLGIIQGTLEWLPISSEGHLIILMTQFLNIPLKDALSVSIYLHTGTVIASIIYFRKKVIEIIEDFLKFRDYTNLTVFLIISTLLTGFFGFFMYHGVKSLTYMVGEAITAIVGIFLIVTGLIEKYGGGKGLKDMEDCSIRDSFILGFFQAFSVIPGLSRSGITVSMLLLLDYEQKSALRLSFIMSIPVIIGAEIGINIFDSPNIPLSQSLIMVLVSFVVGYLSIGFLMNIAERISFWWFCILIGSISLVPFLLAI
ncbi:MAG: undecaprenyl-diphosphate phosphatase [Candidatus Hydrothermarchaeota archaeon]